VAHAVDAQLIDEDLGGTAQIVLTAHRRLPGKSRLSAFAPAVFSTAGSGFTERSIAQVGGAR
jgi:hypothetical protein